MGTAPVLSYVVCAAPRTGSSLLCGTLGHTGVAGRPQEYFDIRAYNETFWRERLQIENPADYVRKVIATATTQNGVFGLKLHWHQNPALRAKLLADGDRTAARAAGRRGRHAARPPLRPARPGALRLAPPPQLPGAGHLLLSRQPHRHLAGPGGRRSPHHPKPVGFDNDEIHRHLALDAIVETEWTHSTFTMNWKLTRPGLPVHFVKGEPICMVVPMPRGFAESLDPVLLPLAENPELQAQHLEWSESRNQFIGDLQQDGSEAVRRGWQKHYYKGQTNAGEQAEEHQTRLKLKEFREPGSA